MDLQKIKKFVLVIFNALSIEKYYWKCRKKTTIKKLSVAQKKEIKKYYWDNLGIKVTTRYHELISSMCGVYHKEYMPFTVYTSMLEKLSPFSFRKIIDDKVLYDWLLPNIRMPERIAACCEGVNYLYYADGTKREVPEKELLEVVSNIDECIIKPSKNSSAGIGVKKISIVNGVLQNTDQTAKQLIDSYHGNFVIEKKVINNENLRRLNPSSCNTLRIHTWRNRENATIEFVSAFLRVGRMGAVVDNSFAGGIAIPVGSDGVLTNSGCVLKNYTRIEHTDTGIALKGYRIENFDQMVEVAINAHNNLPFFDLIGWDITVDENRNIIVIEFNANPDMRLDQLIFLDTCLLDKQIAILSQAFNTEKKSTGRFQDQK